MADGTFNDGNTKMTTILCFAYYYSIYLTATWIVCEDFSLPCAQAKQSRGASEEAQQLNSQDPKPGFSEMAKTFCSSSAG